MSAVASPSKPEAKQDSDILFQTYFKSVGPRTYAAQVKRAGNGNHFVVLTEGKRDENSGEVRKTRLYVFSEDFSAFFKMLQETAVFIRANPLPEEIKQKRANYWKKKAREEKGQNCGPAAKNGAEGGPPMDSQNRPDSRPGPRRFEPRRPAPARK